MTVLRDAILSTVEEFCARTGMSADALGRRSCGDHRLVPRIRQGAVTLRRLEKLCDYMRTEHKVAKSQRSAA